MVGGLIRQGRKARGMSQEVLAKVLGMKQTYLSRLERDEVGLPQRATLEKIGAALGIALPEFYRAAGVLEGVDIAPNPAPPPPELDRAFDPAQMVAWVEAHPGEEFQRRLAIQRAERSPADYEALCLVLSRMWLTSGTGMLDALESLNHK